MCTFPHFYVAMFQVVLALKDEAREMPTENRELQVANYVGPTLVDLRLYEWMEKHGGMVSCVSGTEKVQKSQMKIVLIPLNQQWVNPYYYGGTQYGDYSDQSYSAYASEPLKIQQLLSFIYRESRIEARVP